MFVSLLVDVYVMVTDFNCMNVLGFASGLITFTDMLTDILAVI